MSTTGFDHSILHQVEQRTKAVGTVVDRRTFHAPEGFPRLLIPEQVLNVVHILGLSVVDLSEPASLNPFLPLSNEVIVAVILGHHGDPNGRFSGLKMGNLFLERL